ncbi:MAG: hypothetical protein AB8B63_06495 [Granulosicoccus sp.]
MTAHSYQLNAQGAIEGSNIGYQRITSSGAYTGVFTKAKAITAGTGATGIEFTFKADDGAEANYLTLYTHSKTGEETLGRKQLDSLMACVKVREIKPELANIMEWDNDQGQEIQVSVELYPSLMDNPVGVVLQREEYRKNNGDTGERMNLYSFFNAGTQQNGAEVIQRSEAKSLASTLAALKDKGMKGDAKAPTATKPQQRQTPGGNTPDMSAASKDFDDQIPF